MLRRARDRIADRERWTTGAYARDHAGEIVRPRSPRACRWDLRGAVARESPTDELYVSGLIALARVVGVDPDDPICTFVALRQLNNDGGHRAVLQTLDAAIAGDELTARGSTSAAAAGRRARAR